MSKQSKRSAVNKPGKDDSKPGLGTPGSGGITPQKIDITRGAIDANQLADASIASDVTELELKLLAAGKISDFVLNPSDIKRIWRANRMKEAIVKFLQDLYKPASQFEEEKVEYNKINILAEYQLYNMTHFKNELMMDDYKVAVCLDIMWRLLEFYPESSSSNSQSKATISKKPDITADQKASDAQIAASIPKNLAPSGSCTNSPKKQEQASLSEQQNQFHSMGHMANSQSNNNVGADSTSNNNIEYRGDGIDVERDFQNAFN